MGSDVLKEQITQAKVQKAIVLSTNDKAYVSKELGTAKVVDF